MLKLQQWNWQLNVQDSITLVIMGLYILDIGSITVMKLSYDFTI